MADSTSIGGLTSLRSAWSRCPYWLKVTLRSAACCLASSSARSVARQLITPPSQIPHTPEPTWRCDIRAHGQPGPPTSRLHPVQRSFGGQVKEYAGTWDLPIHAVKYSLYPAAKTFSNTHIDRPLKPPLMRPSLVLVRKAIDRMWFRRHWYWPSGYIVVGVIVALLTNNIHLSSLSGILLSILAVLLWPFILGAALCRLLGFHIPGIDIT